MYLFRISNYFVIRNCLVFRVSYFGFHLSRHSRNQTNTKCGIRNYTYSHTMKINGVYLWPEKK
ncbi:hypothetical protein KsCSTR_36740 [Candidatus Kuenenia stuttgartiensis]|uniref:Uncharacterized protein n=1 Tax=Kuenenia stuttgartiensis TaxID=174633 RepID=Q1Q6F0_KUEST|nr:hypothetical protein KsCSTR_36740 [Candidatus Kuenenia stuttgartiensis]CAJ73144.1 unknown protein [Candidatus Kuenenia stuttgartiensis]